MNTPIVEPSCAARKASQRSDIPSCPQPSVEEVPTAWLVVLSGGDGGAETSLTKSHVLVVGSDPAQAGLVLPDPLVAPRHAQVGYEGGCYVIRDLGGLYGTYVNNNRVIEEALRHNDLVQLGNTRLLFFTIVSPA